MIVRRLVVSVFEANCYIVGDERTRQAFVIDPGDDADQILEALEASRLQAKLILATHAHLDHVMAVAQVREATGAPFMLHPADAPLLAAMPVQARHFLGVELPPPPPVDAWLTAGETVAIDDIPLKVLLTPGHSSGSVSFYWTPPPGERGIVFSGDALFQGSIGRTDLGGDFLTLERSIRTQLYTLPDDTVVLSGHGDATTIGREKRTNPFVNV